MLKEKQEGNDGGGWRGKDDKQGLWGFHPAFLLILIIYGFLKSHQNMMIQKTTKTKLDVLGSLFQGEAPGFWDVRTMNPKANLWNKQQYLNHKLFFIYDSFLEVDQ